MIYIMHGNVNYKKFEQKSLPRLIEICSHYGISAYTNFIDVSISDTQ